MVAFCVFIYCLKADVYLIFRDWSTMSGQQIRRMENVPCPFCTNPISTLLLHSEGRNHPNVWSQARSAIRHSDFLIHTSSELAVECQLTQTTTGWHHHIAAAVRGKVSAMLSQLSIQWQQPRPDQDHPRPTSYPGLNVLVLRVNCESGLNYNGCYQSVHWYDLVMVTIEEDILNGKEENCHI